MIKRRLSGLRIPPELPLSSGQRQAVRARARKLYRNNYQSLWKNQALSIFYAAGWILLIFTVMPLFDNTRLEWVTFLTIPLLVGGGVAISWVVMRCQGWPFVHQALREYGFDVCPKCEYWLRDLGDEVQHCPECGAPRQPMADAAAEKPS